MNVVIELFVVSIHVSFEGDETFSFLSLVLVWKMSPAKNVDRLRTWLMRTRQRIKQRLSSKRDFKFTSVRRDRIVVIVVVVSALVKRVIKFFYYIEFILIGFVFRAVESYATSNKIEIEKLLLRPYEQYRNVFFYLAVCLQIPLAHMLMNCLMCERALFSCYFLS